MARDVKQPKGFRKAHVASGSSMPTITSCYIWGDFGYVVRWPNGTSAWWTRRWEALAARAGWQPPLNRAHPVPNEPFHYDAKP